jgi:hypothetical protein
VSPSRRIVAVVFCVVAAASLTACDTNEIGAAAVVGDNRITIGELQDRVRDFTDSVPDESAAAGADPAVVQHALLDRMIRHELLEQLARDEGIEVSEADIDTFIEEQVEGPAPEGDITDLLAQSGLTDNTLREAVRDVLIQQELVERLGGEEAYNEALVEKAEEIGVKVSPRYGTWTDAGLEATSGSISEPDEGAEDEPADGPTETPAG